LSVASDAHFNTRVQELNSHQQFGPRPCPRRLKEKVAKEIKEKKTRKKNDSDFGGSKVKRDRLESTPYTAGRTRIKGPAD